MKRKILLSPLIIIVLIIILGVGMAGAAIFIGGAGGTEEVNLQKGLVGNWKFDGNAKDSTPYANNGTLTGNAAVTATDRKGQVNKAATFDGTGDYVDINNSVSLQINGDFSAEAWIKASTITQYDGIVSQYNNDAKGFLIDFANTNTLRFIVNPGTGEKSVNSGTINTGQWYHILVSISGTTLKFYQDGVLANTNSSGAAMVASTKNVFIGEGYTGGADFDGLIDDVRIYNRALSPTEITALYESYNPGIQVSDLQKGLVGHWKFDGNAKDATPNSNHGTLAGAAGANNLPQLTNDRKGQALKAYDFDGTDDYVDAANESNFDFEYNTPFSGFAWIKTTGTAREIFSKIGAGPTYKGYTLRIIGNKLELILMGANNTTPNEGMRVYTNQSVNDDNWHFVGFTYDGSNTVAGIKLYVDGVSVAYTTFLNNPTTTTWLHNNTFRIGKNDWAGYWLGLIDDVCIYNRALSAAEVLASYESYDPGIQVSDLQKGLVGQWKFDGNAKDSTPNSNHGTVTGATLTTDRKGQVNKAYSFNGTSDYVSIADTVSLQEKNNLTIEAWVKRSDINTFSTIVSKLSFNAKRAWFLRLENNAGSNKVRFYTSSDGAASQYVDSNTAIADTTNWYHVVATYQFVADNTSIGKIYINGNLDITATNLKGDLYTENGEPVRIGAVFSASDAVDNVFNGLIDEVRIYNRALSAAEVLALYESY